MKHYCYIIKFPNGKSYVGYTSCTPEERFKSHWKQRKARRVPVQRAFCKYKKEDLILETLEIFDDQESALKAEQYYIKTLNTYVANGHGYNATLGGEAPCMTWMETKTKEEIDDINKRKGHPGELNPFYGKTHSEETKRKAVETRRQNGDGDYFQGNPPILSEKSKERIKKRMKSNNPMKDKVIAQSASKKRMKTITTFEYWLNQYFYSKLGEHAEEVRSYLLEHLNTITSREIQEKFNIKRGLADSMIKRFKEQSMVVCPIEGGNANRARCDS